MARYSWLAALLLGASGLLAQAGAGSHEVEAPTGFLAETITVDRVEHRYVLFVPPTYRNDRSWPLLVFLHGAGECGVDGWKQVAVGLGPAILSDVATWPFVVLFPQKPDVGSAWEDHDAVVMAMLEQVRTERRVDEKQMFLTGLSQGGHGTWVLGARHAQLWAAIAPICGYGMPGEIAPALAKMPIWCFHGEEDKAVPCRQSQELVAAVLAAGGHAELTLYPHVGHNSWEKAYGEAPLAEWLLAAALDPVYASYLTSFEQVTHASIEVSDERSPDEDPAVKGTAIVNLDLDREGLKWRATEYRGTAQATPEPAKGELEVKAGRARLLQRLRELQAGGVLRLPKDVMLNRAQGMRPETTQPLPQHHYTIDITLDGKPGVWRFHRDVPRLAVYDPQFREPVRRLSEFVNAVQELH